MYIQPSNYFFNCHNKQTLVVYVYDKYHVLPNKQQIRITNLCIKVYIDEKFTQLIRT